MTPACSPPQFQKLPIIGGVFRKLDRDIERYGLQKAMMAFISQTGNKIEVFYKHQEIKKVLKKSPVIIIANHPHDVEIVPLLAASPCRKDVFIACSVAFIGVGFSFTNHLIPIYVRKKIKNASTKLSVKVGTIMGIGQHKISDDEAHFKNIESIKLASEKINNGGLVVLFPEGVGRKTGCWFPGIGYLIKDLKNPEEMFVVKAYVEGTSMFDVLRVVPLLKRFLLPFKVTFSKPTKISQIIKKGGSPKKITKILQEDYVSWKKALN